MKNKTHLTSTKVSHHYLISIRDGNWPLRWVRSVEIEHREGDSRFETTSGVFVGLTLDQSEAKHFPAEGPRDHREVRVLCQDLVDFHYPEPQYEVTLHKVKVVKEMTTVDFE